MEAITHWAFWIILFPLWATLGLLALVLITSLIFGNLFPPHR